MFAFYCTECDGWIIKQRDKAEFYTCLICGSEDGVEVLTPVEIRLLERIERLEARNKPLGGVCKVEGWEK